MPAQPPAPRLADVFPESARAGAALRGRGWRVAVAESCTGGLLGAVLTAVPGASAYMLGGVIAYDNEVKSQLLGVSPGLIARMGAVSAEVAAALALGVRERLGVEVGVGITGVAGPGSEEGGKPAGLAFVGITSPELEKVVRLDGDHGREANRAACVRAALELIIELG